MFPRLRTVLVALALYACISLLAPPRVHGAGVVTSSAHLPFAGSFFDSLTGEVVDLAGAIHVVTQLSCGGSSPDLTLHANIPADVIGTGRTSLQSYLAQGTALQHLIPGDPCRGGSVSADVIFMVRRPSEIPGDPCHWRLTLRFAADGTLLVGGDGGSTATLCGENSCSVD